MPKNIVICSDGTGNSAVKGRGTNVFKLFEAVDLQQHQQQSSLLPQIAYYDDGVGTEQLKPLKILGGAFGWGLSRNVRDLYLELARVYDPGDHIFLFGFSRGAFTVRTLAGLIAQVGVVDRSNVPSDAALYSLVKRAYRQHRKCYQRLGAPDAAKRAQQADEFRFLYSVKDRTYTPEGKVEIDFVGVWDTVDAVGFPLDELADLWNTFIYRYKFPDTFLSPQVKRAAHALAIDDERATFHPVMWNESKETSNRIEQVWFSGVHSNVGGGYTKQGMSLVALVWMMEQAEQSGLRFVPSARQLCNELQNVNDKLYDSRSGLASYYRYTPRPMAKLCCENSTVPKVHISTVERIAMGTDGYSPGNLPRDLEVISNTNPQLATVLTTAIRSAWDDGRPLLEHGARLVRLKMALQRAFTTCSLLTAAYVAWQLGWAELGSIVSFSGAVKVARILFEVPWVLAILAALLVASFWSSGRISSTYSEFWFPLRSRLREILLSRAMSAGQS